ncbi:hypothetical protein ACH4NC_17065 [Streptomyces sp. NPDC017201]|uniref:hypothetical protein n=3 Tax=Streptomyces TaxID=1883 RepID=UPI0033A8993B
MPGWAMARTAGGLSSAMVALHGWDGSTAQVARDVESNAYGPHSATPGLRLEGHPGGRSVLVSPVALSRDTVHPEALRHAVSVRAAGDGPVTLAFLGGTTVEVGMESTSTAGPRSCRSGAESTMEG